jgi:nucleobase transporter 1/2
MVAALVEMLLGLSGAVGVLLRYIGPLSICPTISLLGLSLFKAAAGFGAKQWWICMM